MMINPETEAKRFKSALMRIMVMGSPRWAFYCVQRRVLLYLYCWSDWTMIWELQQAETKTFAYGSRVKLLISFLWLLNFLTIEPSNSWTKAMFP